MTDRNVTFANFCAVKKKKSRAIFVVSLVMNVLKLDFVYNYSNLGFLFVRLKLFPYACAVNHFVNKHHVIKKKVRNVLTVDFSVDSVPALNYYRALS